MALRYLLVTFFSAIISSYGKNYLKGFEYHSKFLLLCLGFTFSIMFFVMSNHVALLVSTWLMGVLCLS
jgi:NAD(P)H-quinone oxidoreductase subunit 5